MTRQITKELPEFAHYMRKYYKSVNNSCFHNASESQINVFVYLMKNQDREVNQKELEKVLRLKKSTISSVLDTMEKNNMIERISSKIDKRKKFIKLNMEYFPSEEVVIAHFSKAERLLRKNISEEELNTFFNVLDKMKENLKEEANNV